MEEWRNVIGGGMEDFYRWRNFIGGEMEDFYGWRNGGLL